MWCGVMSSHVMSSIVSYRVLLGRLTYPERRFRLLGEAGSWGQLEGAVGGPKLLLGECQAARCQSRQDAHVSRHQKPDGAGWRFDCLAAVEWVPFDSIGRRQIKQVRWADGRRKLAVRRVGRTLEWTPRWPLGWRHEGGESDEVALIVMESRRELAREHLIGRNRCEPGGSLCFPALRALHGSLGAAPQLHRQRGAPGRANEAIQLTKPTRRAGRDGDGDGEGERDERKCSYLAMQIGFKSHSEPPFTIRDSQFTCRPLVAVGLRAGQPFELGVQFAELAVSWESSASVGRGHPLGLLS